MNKVRVYKSYSPAFRYPLVIGKVNGLQLPFRFTVQQAGVFLLSIIFGFKSRGLWESFLPLSGFWILLAVGGFSIWVSWLVQYKQVEGRHPISYAAGWIKYFSTTVKQKHKPEPVCETVMDFRQLPSTSKQVALTRGPEPRVFAGWEVFGDG